MTSALSVGRFAADYRVSRAHPTPETLRWRLDEVLHRRLPEALGPALAALLDDASDEVVVIRRLRADLELDASREAPLLARRWAARVASALGRALYGQAEGEVLRFPRFASYLASFLAARARGGAAQAWLYRPFRGLDVLPASAALRTALLDDPVQGAAALHALAPRDRHDVLAALGQIEARRVMKELARLGSGGRQPAPLAALLDAFAAARSFLDEEAPWLAALDLVARTAHGVPSAHWTDLVETAVAIVTLAGLLAREGAPTR